MSTPVVPVSLIMFKIVREYERTKRTHYSCTELFTFAHRALQIAGHIDNEEYWILASNKYGTDFHEKMSKICDIDSEEYQLNADKYSKGGKAYAKKIIGAMPYSFLKGAVQALSDDLNLPRSKAEGFLCD